jgi:radical SAM protein with 4Fe4S-binding SPASM domain
MEHDNIMKDIPGFPKKIMLEVSSLCNHKCIFCSTQKSHRKKRIIDDGLANKIIEEAYGLGCREISFHAMGEPLMCSNLKNYIKKAKELGYEYVYIDTNGALAAPGYINPVVDAGLDSIKFSIGAANRDDYIKIHQRDDFDKVINNLVSLFNYKNSNGIKLKIIVGFAETKYTLGQGEELKKLIGKYIDEIWIYGVTNQGGNMSEDNLGLYIDKKCEKNLCKEPFDRIVVTSEGLVTACCMDNDNNLVYGNVNDNLLSEIWTSPNAQAIRKQHLTGENLNYFCKNCYLEVFYNWNKDR